MKAVFLTPSAIEPTPNSTRVARGTRRWLPGAGWRTLDASMEPSRTRRYPFVSRGEPTPVAIARTEGPWLVTPDGRRIYDAAGGAIVANVGHGRTEVADAVREALVAETYVVPPFATPSRLRLTERLQERWLPAGPHAASFSRAAARRRWTPRCASRASTTSPRAGPRAGR